jgi:Ca-activated chloride channel family protein
MDGVAEVAGMLASPGWLHLLWGLPVLTLLALHAAQSRRRGMAALFSAGILANRGVPGLARQRAWTSTLVVLGFALAAIAAAQPRWGFTWRELRAEGVEVVLALDVSRSMDAQDVEPSRMERARREILDLLELLPGDRVGLVIFAAGAYPRVPLTVDHDALGRIVRGTDTGTIQAQGSSLSSALRESVRLFSEEIKADRAILVLSDGEIWDQDLTETVAMLVEANVRVFAMGIGTPEGAPIPIAGGGFKKDQGGSVVLSQLQEEALQQVAAATGGSYLRSVASAGDAEALATRLHGELTSTVTTVKRDKVWDERFQWPLAAGLALLLIVGFMGDGRIRRSVAVLMLAGMFAGGSAQAGALEDARQLLASGQAADAVDALTGLQVENPNDPGVAWALGEALFADGRFDDAATVFTDLADRAPDAEFAQGSRYNSGLSHYGAGRLEQAVRDWDRVVEQAPENEAARQNAEAVRQELARRTQEPPPEDSQDQEGEPSDGEGDTGQGAPQEGEPGDTGGSEQQGEPTDTSESGDGTRPMTPSESEDAGEPEGEIQAVDGSQDTATPEAPLAEGVQELSAEEATRLLESVDEGNPRVTVRGRSYGKDW